MIDLDSFRRRYVTAWGDRMTIGVLVSELRELCDELTNARESLRVQRAALENAEVQRAYWEQMARAAYTEQQRLALQVSDLMEARDGETKRDDG